MACTASTLRYVYTIHYFIDTHVLTKQHPDLTPDETWKTVFSDSPEAAASAFSSPYFTPSKTVAHKEMLRILREEPADTVTIVAVGPLTNVALAAAEDPETFLRVKEVVVMGGTVFLEGNITPNAEFNCYADAVAAARVYALTSPTPASTMPPTIHGKSVLPAYPEKLSRQLKLTLMPLDITTPHLLSKNYFLERITPFESAGSPLARWCKTFMVGTFNKIDSMVGDGSEPGLSLHDPLCIWYMLLRDDERWTNSLAKLEDLRVETSGQWTRGMHVIDRRTRSNEGLDEVPGDTMGWLSKTKGNRINRIVGSPGTLAFAEFLMSRLFE